MAKVADRYLTTDPWRIVEDGYHPERSRVSESIFSLSNEHMGVRGYFEEGYSGSSLVGCYVNGIYEEHLIREATHYRGIPNRVCFMVNIANWLHTRIELGGEILDLNRVQHRQFRRELDLRTGELRREFIWKTKAGHELKVAFARQLSMRTKELGLQRITLFALNFSGPISVTVGIDFAVAHEMYGRSFWNCPRQFADDGRAAIVGVSQNTRHKVFAGFRVRADGAEKDDPVVDEHFVGRRLTVDLVEGVERAVEKVNVLFTTRDRATTEEEAWRRGVDQLEHARHVRYDDVLAENARYWDEFWGKSDIVIEGDPDTQQGIRFCIFQLQQAYRGVVEGSNIGAKGLTGEEYNGNAFWDTEAYCLPYYLFSNPEAAKALLEFRYRTLPQALARAKELDCDGACFPIATIEGSESCTLWQHSSLQFQPTTAVAYAIAHYVKVTRDYDFLYGDGAELLIQICRFLASRGQWSPRRNKFGYYAVMGPDEFQVMVNNNCYTNYMAKRTFLFTLDVLGELELHHPERKKELFETLAVQAGESATWREMADQMNIPFDPATGVYEQHEGFFDLPHIDVDAIPATEFPLYRHWSYDRIYRNDMIKQPDVLMFMFLYSQSFGLAEKQANYDYYEPRCIHESSLSPSLHSIIAAELGRMQEAFEFFRFATRIDLDDYNRNTSEGIHMTSSAGAWMNVVCGYGGLRSDGEQLVFNPTIPAHWQAYCFQVVYRSSLVRVNVTQDSARIQLLEGAPVSAVVGGRSRVIDRDGVVVQMECRKKAS
jgi:maltose phosphorylase